MYKMTETPVDKQLIINNIRNLPVIEFVERTTGIKLMEWQKELLKKYEGLPRNVKIIFGRNGRISVVEAIKKD